MAVWTVHAPPDGDDPMAAAAAARFVKEGFSPAAFLFGPLWLIAQRMWIVLLGWLVVVILLQLLRFWTGPEPVAVIGLLASVLFGLQARDLQRWTLERRGWRLAGVVEGGDRDTAERRFFEAWVARAGEAPEAGGGPDRPSGGPARPSPRPPPQEVIGLFPSHGGRRG